MDQRYMNVINAKDCWIPVEKQSEWIEYVYKPFIPRKRYVALPLDKLPAPNGITLIFMELKYLLRIDLFNSPLPLYNVSVAVITDAHFVTLLHCPRRQHSSGRT